MRKYFPTLNEMYIKKNVGEEVTATEEEEKENEKTTAK